MTESSIPKRLMRIAQKPPYAYVVGGIFLALFVVASFITFLPPLISTVLIMAPIMSAWWFFERGASHQKRLEERDRRTRQLTSN